MKKILFVAAHRLNRSPSQRFRFEQFFNYLEQNGFQCELSYLLSEKDDGIFYSQGSYPEKFYILLKNFIKRLKDVVQASRYDIIFIQREAFFTRSIFFEKCFRKVAGRIIFDFDDAIWLHDISDANKKLGWLKNPKKTSKIIQLADMVFAGNQFLADYALQFNKNVVVIPTTIDTSYHKKTTSEKKDSRICVGWTGSHTTIKHFEYALPFLKKLKEKYSEKIYFKVIGDEDFVNDELEIKGIAWKADTEIQEISEIDIGIMPLPNDDWAKGKCGLKGLQYMALEIPTVLSPVGVNKEIVEDGLNGFLASLTDEWVEKISRLINSKELREQIGKAGRKTVIEKYSFESQKEKYLNCFKELLNKKT